MQKHRTGVYYINPLYWPGFFCFCPNARAWKAELTRLGHPNDPYPTSDGHCRILHKDGKALCIVTVAEKTDENCDAIQIAALLAHEAVHVWQVMRDAMGERSPGVEQEAYSIQHITQELLNAYQKTRRPIYAPAPSKQKSKRGRRHA